MKTKQYGYSLVEILVVMAIVMITAGGGIHGWRHWQSQSRLQQTAQALNDYLQQVRHGANGYNQTREIRHVEALGRWCLNSGPLPLASCAAGRADLFLPPWPDVALASITEGLAFYGLRNTAWPGHIGLANRAGEVRLIVSTQGRIRLCRGGGTC